MLNLTIGKKYRIYIKVITLVVAFIFIFENIGYSFLDISQNKTSLRKPLDFNDQKSPSRYFALMITAKAKDIRDHLTPEQRDYLSSPLKTNCLLVALDIKPAYWSRTGMPSEELNMLQEIAKNLGLRFVSYKNGGQMLCFVYNPRGLAKIFLQNRTELLNPSSYIAEEIKSKDFISLLENINLQVIIDAGDFSAAEQDIAQLDEYLAYIGYREKDWRVEGEVFPIGLAVGYGSENARMFLKYQKEKRTTLLYPITSARHNIWFTAADKEAGQRLLDDWVKAADIATSIIAGATGVENGERLTKKEIRDMDRGMLQGKLSNRAERMERSDEKYRDLVLFTAWQRMKESDSQSAEEILKFLKPKDRVGLSDLALMFDEKVNTEQDALALTELSHKISKLAKPQPGSLNAVKNRIIFSFLDFINHYGLYRLAAYPEFLAFLLFAALSGALNPLALPFIVAGGAVSQIDNSDKEWVRNLVINALALGLEEVVNLPIVEEKMKDDKIRAMIANFRLDAEDIRLINESIKEFGKKQLSDEDIQAEFESFRMQLSELYGLEPGYIVRGRGVTLEEDRPQIGRKKRPGQKRDREEDFSNVEEFGSRKGARPSSGKGKDIIRDLEERLLANPATFWSSSDITWGQKLACLRQVVNERSIIAGMGLTVQFLDDDGKQELTQLISREPAGSPLHGLVIAIAKEKERREAEQKAMIQENIAEAKRLQSVGELQAATEGIERVLILSPDNQEALSLKSALVQELEDKGKEMDIENRLRASLEVLYRYRLRLRDKKITKEEKASLENPAKEARLLIRALSVEYPSLYLKVLKEYESDGRFYTEMLEILTQGIFEYEYEKAFPILEAVLTVSPTTMSYFWQDKNRLKNKPGFRRVLLVFMLNRGDIAPAVLNVYLLFERDFIIDSILKQGEGEDNYLDLLLKLMVREGRYAGEDREREAREELKNGALEIIKIVINRDMDKLSYLLTLFSNSRDINLGEQILGYLFLKINNFTKRVLYSISEEEKVAVFSEFFLASINFYKDHSRQEISNILEASLVQILEEATDFVYENSSFELPRNITLFIEYLRNKDELTESVFSIQTEIASYLEEYDYTRLIEALKREDISYKERLAILYRIAILWTGALKGKGNLKEIEAMCDVSDPFVRACLYYALALVRSSKYSDIIMNNIMHPEYRRIVVETISAGTINRDAVMSILYELKLGNIYNKLFLGYGVVASLGIKRRMSVGVPGEDLSNKILRADGVPYIREALDEAVQNDWIINNTEDKKIIEDLIWIFDQPLSARRSVLDTILNLLSRGEANINLPGDYERIISNAKDEASGLQGGINHSLAQQRQSL